MEITVKRARVSIDEDRGDILKKGGEYKKYVRQEISLIISTDGNVGECYGAKVASYMTLWAANLIVPFLESEANDRPRKTLVKFTPMLLLPSGNSGTSIHRA
jgi:hypothetical protein